MCFIFGSYRTNYFILIIFILGKIKVTITAFELLSTIRFPIKTKLFDILAQVLHVLQGRCLFLPLLCPL